MYRNFKICERYVSRTNVITYFEYLTLTQSMSSQWVNCVSAKYSKYVITVQFRSICQSQVTGPPDRTKFRICHGSLSYLTKVLHITHAEIMVNIVIFLLIESESDEISPLSRPSSQGDEIKISSGTSRCHMGDKSIKIVQYICPTHISFAYFKISVHFVTSSHLKYV